MEKLQRAGKPRLSAGINMYSDDNSEQRKQPEKNKGVHQNRSAASPEVAEVYGPMVAGKLKQEPRRQQHEQNHPNEDRSPVRHFYQFEFSSTRDNTDAQRWQHYKHRSGQLMSIELGCMDQTRKKK